MQNLQGVDWLEPQNYEPEIDDAFYEEELDDLAALMATMSDGEIIRKACYRGDRRDLAA